jgi:WD40 repeat protein
MGKKQTPWVKTEGTAGSELVLATRFTPLLPPEKTDTPVRKASVLSHPTIDYGILRFSPDGKILVAADNRLEGEISIWNVQKGTLVRRHKAGGQISTIAISPNGTLLAEGTHPEILRVYNLPGGEMKFEKISRRKAPDGQLTGAYRIQFSPGGTYLTTIGYSHGRVSCDPYYRVWNLATGNELARWKWEWKSECARWTCDGRYLFYPADDMLQIFQAGTWEKVKEIMIPGLQSVVPIPGTGNIAVHRKNTGAKQDSISLYSLPSMNPVARASVPGGYVLQVSSDGKLMSLLTGVEPGVIIKLPDLGVLWKGIGFYSFIPASRLIEIRTENMCSIADPYTGKVLATFPYGELLITPCGRLAACVPSPNGSSPAELFDLKTGRRISISAQNIGTLAFSPDGKILALWEPGGIRFYNPWATLEASEKEWKQVPMVMFEF